MNHFVEYDEGIDAEGIPHYGIIVHCGSRNFGKMVCNYWESIADEGMPKKEKNELLREYKTKYKENHDSLDNLMDDFNAYIAELTKEMIPGYLTGEKMNGYLCDMVIAMAYARFNHRILHKTIEKIVNVYGLRPVKEVVSRHNYIDFYEDRPLIRKGAIRSHKGEEMIVPFNMRDGVAICEGKSNPDWLNSCCHGAGRVMSRTKAKEQLSLDEFKDQMKDIYSTTVSINTLDESPMAYKPMEEIKELIKDTCDIKYMLKPKINIKFDKRIPEK